MSYTVPNTEAQSPNAGNPGWLGSGAGGRFDVDNPPPDATRTVIVAQMRFKALNMVQQGTGAVPKIISIQVGDSFIAAHYGGLAPAGKWLLEGTLQTISGPQQINQVVDNPNDDLDVTFNAFQEVSHGTPFVVDVSDLSSTVFAKVAGNAPGNSTYGVTVSGEVDMITMYESEE